MSLTADLSGKRALITGASSGLGAHFAKVLARSGADVVVAARRKEALDQLVEQIASDGGRALALPLDVTEKASVSRAVAEAGDLDILVNNAGVTVTKPVLDSSEVDYDFVLDANLKGAFLVATEVARSMKARQATGTIINIASILGLRQGGMVTTYAMSKAGLIQMTKQMALELSRYNIRVNALAPGYIVTDLNRDFFESDPGKALIKRIPQRRLGQLGDLDGPLLLLASDNSDYMTGAVIVADGGHTVSGL